MWLCGCGCQTVKCGEILQRYMLSANVMGRSGIGLGSGLGLASVIKIGFKKWRSSIHTWRCTIFGLKFWWPFLSHHRLLVTFLTHYLLPICDLAPLPLSRGAPELTSATYMWRNATMEKTEVAEHHSGALRLTLTTLDLALGTASTFTFYTFDIRTGTSTLCAWP